MDIKELSEIAYPQVNVYWNFHKKCFSIQDAKTRRVSRHARSVWLADVTFKVSEAGRQRVIKEKRKNVHAYICGKLLLCTKVDNDTLFNNLDFHFDMLESTVVSYNPYKHKDFRTDGDYSIEESESALLMALGNGISFIRAETPY